MNTPTLPATDQDECNQRFSRDHLINRFKEIRQTSLDIVAPLEPEDFVIQVMTNTSPTKWHLAHVSWFFETFVLAKADVNYESLHPQYAYLFNSYYRQTGQPFSRSERGFLSRPTVEEVLEYRRYVNQNIIEFLEDASDDQLEKFGPVIEIGNNHEQQHQELIITDFKFMFAQNPLYPVYREQDSIETQNPGNLGWVKFEEGVYEIGNAGGEFIYDNEQPRHRRFLEPFELGNRLITNAEFIKFIEDDGYDRSELWLDDGWSAVKENGWEAPLYWLRRDGDWYNYTLSGLRKVGVNEPVTHVSYYEADAFARWAGARLPTEAEWEAAAGDIPYEGNFVENETFHPQPLQQQADGLTQMYGDVWEWTKSAYDAYPGYRPLEGALGEYNGKFMCSQYVLRGGACATSKTHIRKTYRNFFYPDARWQFNGIRLAKTL